MENNKTCYFCGRVWGNPSISSLICIDPQGFIDRRWACMECIKETDEVFHHLLNINPKYQVYYPDNHPLFIMTENMPSDLFPIREEAIDTIRTKHLSSEYDKKK